MEDENLCLFLQAEVENLTMQERTLDDQIRLSSQFPCQSNK